MRVFEAVLGAFLLFDDGPDPPGASPAAGPGAPVAAVAMPDLWGAFLVLDDEPDPGLPVPPAAAGPPPELWGAFLFFDDS